MAGHYTGSREFCPDCGAPQINNLADNSVTCTNVKCKTNHPLGLTEEEVNLSRAARPDTSFTKDLGPVRLPTREEVLDDSRRARWIPLTHLPGPPHDRSYVIGCYRRVGIEGALKMVWYMRQVMPDEGGELLVFNCPATHWAEDVSGSPVA